MGWMILTKDFVWRKLLSKNTKIQSLDKRVSSGNLAGIKWMENFQNFLMIW